MSEPEISYNIRSSRKARKVRITVSRDGSVLLVKPFFVSRARAEAFLHTKRGWVARKVAEFKNKPTKLLAHFSAKEYRENKDRAYEVVSARVAHFNKFYKHQLGNIYIRNQKTRWGSCSARGNLSFNYKIIFLPPELRDYIVIHELCHLKEMNHSRNFWDLVALQVPDHPALRQQTKLY